MPATVFPATGYSVRISATDDITSNAAAWYLNDLNQLTTTVNTATNKTFYFENDVATIGTFTEVRIYTSSTVQVNYDLTTYNIISNDESTSNFIPYYTNELNLLTSIRNSPQIRTFFINNYNNINLGNFVRVRITGPLYSEEIDVIRKTNTSFTIALPSNWPANSTGFTVSLGRYDFVPTNPYSQVISVTSSTSRSFNLTKPVGFPEVGAAIYAIIPSGAYSISDPVGVNARLDSASLNKNIGKINQPVGINPTLPIFKGIKVELKNDQTKNTFASTKVPLIVKDPTIIPSRQITVSTSSIIQYIDYPIRITGSDLARNFNLSWYIKDENTLSLILSTSNSVTYSFVNPNYPFSLGTYTKAKLIGQSYEKVIDVVTNTNNSITVLKLPEFPLLSQLSMYLGNPIVVTNTTLTDSNQVPVIRQFKSPAVESKSNLPSALINKSGIKIAGENTRFRSEQIRQQSLLREPITVPARTVTYTNFTNTVYSDLIRVTGRSGITSNASTYYVFESNQLIVTRTTSNFVTLFFVNPNNNQSIGPVSTVRLLGSRFEATVSVQSYTNDSVTIADIFKFYDIQSQNPFGDLFIRLGVNFVDRTVGYTNTNQIGQINLFKTNAITGVSHSLSVPKLTSSIVLRDTRIRFTHTDFRTVSKVIGESRIFKIEQTQKTQIQIKEPIVLPSRTITSSTFTTTIFSDLIRITGNTGISNNFNNYYIYENNQITVTRSTSSSVTLFFNNNNQNFGNILIARLISPAFDITINVQSYTNNSITVANIFGFGDSQSQNTINDLYVRLGINFLDKTSTLSDAGRVALINPLKIPVALSSRVDQVGKTKLKDSNFSTIEIPRVSTYKNVTSLRDTISYTPQPISIPASTATLYSPLIDITGKVESTSSFISYYINEENSLRTFTTTTSTITLLYSGFNLWTPNPTVIKLFAYQTIDNIESLRYETTLPILAITSQSVTINWVRDNYKLRAQLGRTISFSSGTYANYYTSGLAVANITTPKYRATSQQVFSIGTSGKLQTQSPRLSTSITPLAVSRFKQEIVIKGEGRTFAQRSTIVTTSTNLILDPFPIYIYGNSLTTSTAVKWYYNEENILGTFNSTSTLITLYFGVLPIYQQSTAPFIKLFAPNGGFENIYPVVTSTIDSVTIQSIGIFPSISGMYFNWARTRQTETYRYSDVGHTPQLNSQTFRQFQDPNTNKIYSSFTSTEQGWVVYDRRVTDIAYVGTSTELILNAPIIIPEQGTFAKIQYVNSNYYESVVNRQAIRFNGTDTSIQFSASTVIGIPQTTRTPIMAEAWINLDAAEGCIIMSEEYSGGADPINLTLAVGGSAPTSPGTQVWFGFYDGVSWTYALTNKSLLAGQWYHVAGQFDGNQIKIYINGYQDGTVVTPAGGWHQPGAITSFFIGRRWDTFPGDGQRPFFKGLMYQARIVMGQIVYTKNFVPPLNTRVGENSGGTRFLACSVPISQPQLYVEFPRTGNYTVNGAIRADAATIPPRYVYDAYPEEIYEINSATSTRIYLKGNIAYRPIVNTEYLRDNLFDRPINRFDIYFLGVSKNYPVIKSSSTNVTTSITIGSLRQSIPKLAYGIEIPQVGKAASIPKLRETLGFSSKSISSITSSTQLVFNPTPLPVYGITRSTSTFVSYYINETNTIQVLPVGSAFTTLYLGNNPEYFRVLGTVIRIVNPNVGYDRQFNIVSSTLETVTIAFANDLPSVSGMLLYYGSVQTSYPSVNYTDSNMVGKISKNTVGASFIEIRPDQAGAVKQSILVKSDNIRFTQSQLEKKFTQLRGGIEVPRTQRLSTVTKVGDPGIYQNPTYTVSTSSELLFYNTVNITGRLASTSSFITYYTYENNTIRTFTTSSVQKVFYLSEYVRTDLGLSHIRLQNYRFDSGVDNLIFDRIFPITSLSSSSVTFNFVGDLPEGSYRGSLGRYITSYNQIFSGTNSVSLLGIYRTPVVGSYQTPGISQIEKRLIVLRDFVPSISTGMMGQSTKIKLAGDRSYSNPIVISTSNSSLLFLDPVNISGRSGTTSNFVTVYIREEEIVRTFASTSANITLYFDRPIQVTGDYTVARLTNFVDYNYTATIVSVTNQSVTIVNPNAPIIPNSGITVYLGKIWPGEQFRRITYDSALQIPGINRFRMPNTLPSVGISTIEIPSGIGKLTTATPLRYISNINRFTTNQIRVVTNLRSEKNAEPQRTRTVTTASSISYDPYAYRIYGTNLSTSTAVKWYYNEENILTTFFTTSTTLILNLGILPLSLQAQSRNTHIKLTNGIGYDEQFTITNYTAETVSINMPINLPSISSLTLYFGSLRSFETVVWSDNSQIAKFNYKWTNWFSQNQQDRGVLSRQVVSLKSVIDQTKLSLIQKPVNYLKSSIEVPNTAKVTAPIIIKEVGRYTPRTISITTAQNILYVGPFDATGRIGSTSSFVTNYILDTELLTTSIYTGSIVTLFFSSYYAQPSEGFNTVRVQGINGLQEAVDFDLTLPITTLTNYSVSFNIKGLPFSSRYKIFLGRPIVTTSVSVSDSNRVESINRVKNYQGFSAVETPRISQLNKSSIVVKDFTNNIRLGQAKSLTKIAGDRSYSVSTSTIVFSTQTIYQDPVPITGINRSQTNFVQTYINDQDLVNISYNTSSIITLFLAQGIQYTGQATTVKIVRYSSGSYVNNRFTITNTEFESDYPIISYSTNTITINAGLNSFIDYLRPLAAYVGQPFTPSSAIRYTNTSTLAVAVAGYKPTIGITGFAISTITAKVSSGVVIKGLPSSLKVENFKPKSTAVVKSFADNIKTGRAVTIPTVRDGYYPNLTSRTRTVTTNTTIVYDAQIFRIYGTNLSTSTFVNNYIFENDIVTTYTQSTSTITLFVGSLPIIAPAQGLYVRITDLGSFNTVTQVLSRGSGHVVINTPDNLPSISNLYLYLGAMTNVETIAYSDTNYTELNLFNDITAGIAYRKDQITYPTFVPRAYSYTGTTTALTLGFSYLQGQQSFTTPGTYYWTAPPGVTQVSVVAVGAGGRGGFGGQAGTYKASGGGGGGLGWKNNITVVPGQTYLVVVGAGGSISALSAADTTSLGASGGNSFFISSSTVAGLGGVGGGSPTITPVGGGFIGDGGGTGGTGGSGGQNAEAGGGGGAAGYTGNGGDAGGFAYSSPGSATATAGSGGGGGGGDKGSGRANGSPGYAGGGVGLLGLGSNGAAGSSGVGGGGSGGSNGVLATDIGGTYGGGGPANNGAGGGGAVRIIWGTNRGFPSTSTADVNAIELATPKAGDYIKVTDAAGVSVLSRISSVGLTGINIPTADTANLSGLPTTWSMVLWDPSVIPQLQVRTTTAPITPRERLYYSLISSGKYGRSLSLRPIDSVVSPINLIPAKTRTVTTSSGLVWKYQSFNIYGTDLIRQTDLSWYTTEGNLYNYQFNTGSNLVLYFGSLPAPYSAIYLTNTHIRLNNNQGYDQVFPILTSTIETVTISNPITLPSISSLRAFFGSTGTVETLVWNDQGIVPTFTTILTSSIYQSKIILAEGGIISLPSTFKTSHKVIDSSIIVNRTQSPLAIFTDTRAGISYNRYSAGYYSAPVALSSSTSVTGTTTILNFLTQAVGQQVYTTPGTYSWTAPANVFYVSAVAVGAGGAGGVGRAFGDRQRGGGGGGGLGWKNMIPVVPGQSYTVQVGAAGTGTSSATGAGPFGNGNPGEASWFISSATVAGFGGTGATNVNFAGVAGVGGGYIGDGGGFGGNGGVDVTTISEGRGGGGGGAGGYVGNGGRGGDGTNSATPATQPTNGSGGGGAGGSSVYGTFNDNGNAQASSGAGGGVGLLGLGANGIATPNQIWVGNPGSSVVLGGGGGSGGAQGGSGQTAFATGLPMPGAVGGAYGAGGGGTGAGGTLSPIYTGGTGGGGAVRLIWGTGRGFPSSYTADQTSIDLTTSIQIGDYIRVLDSVGNSRVIEIKAISTTTMSVDTVGLNGLVGLPDSWTVTPWDPSVYPQSSVIITTRPTTPRENLALPLLAPGLRYNRTITQGIQFSTSPNDPPVGPLKSSIILKSPTNLVANTLTNYVFKIDSENTASTITTGLDNPKAILYYTNIAPGIRGGTYYNSSQREIFVTRRDVGVPHSLPLTPPQINTDLRMKLVTTTISPSGAVNKQVIGIKHVPTQFDRVGNLKMVQSLSGDTLRSTISFVNRPKLAPTGWNNVEVVSRGVIDRKLTVLKSGGAENFVSGNVKAGIEVVPDPNRYFGNQRIRIVQYLATPSTIIRPDIINIAKTPVSKSQVFEAPIAASLSRQISQLKTVESSIRIVSDLNFVSKYIAPSHYAPVTPINRARLLDLVQVRFNEQRGKLDEIIILRTFDLGTRVAQIQKPVTKLIFEDNDYFNTTAKLATIQKDKFKLFDLDRNQGLIQNPAEFIDLETIQFEYKTGKIFQPFLSIRTPVDLDDKPFGSVSRIDKLALPVNNFAAIAQVKIGQEIGEASNVRLSVDVRGLITKFIASKSGILHDPSTRRAPPIQFWN